jgi:hypothetical protein
MVLVSETCQEAVDAFKEARATTEGGRDPNAIPSPWEKWEYSGDTFFVSRVSVDPPMWIDNYGTKFDKLMYENAVRTSRRIS